MSRRERAGRGRGRSASGRAATRSYDIVKEAYDRARRGAGARVRADGPVLVARPEQPSTVKSWSRGDPVDFVTTAVSELDGTSETRAPTARPTTTRSEGQHIAFIHLQKWLGVSHPINAAQDFVLAPLRSITGQPALQSARVRTYEAAPAKQQTAWTTAYDNGAGQGQGRPRRLDLGQPAGNYGPVPADDGRAAHVRAERRPRRRAADQPAVLPDRLHQAAAVHGRRRRAHKPRPGPAPARVASGG